ncbi:hypothetical protein IFM89_007501 [Coptis chinensis]|uniref:Uncharacterized protein n=1 Tax=Coptis chinensis TaxID=261450 RepID=A0A835LHW3_9MAGN|nr:hypothetical protein IFM89_007501 [Coptis chinensis]
MKKSSTLWSGLKEALKLIEDHSTWVVGNGKGIYLWKDRWAGEKSVSELLMANNPFWKPLTNTLSAYIKPTGWNFSPTMTYILSQVGIEVSQLQDPVAQQEDKRVWKHTPNGQFTVRSACEAIIDKQPSPPWHKFL